MTGRCEVEVGRGQLGHNCGSKLELELEFYKGCGEILAALMASYLGCKVKMWSDR